MENNSIGYYIPGDVSFHWTHYQQHQYDNYSDDSKNNSVLLSREVVGRMRILITGAAGYVGSYLAQRLIRLGYDCTLIDNYLIPSNILEVDGVPIHRIDIRSELDCSKYDIVFHLAALSGIKSCDIDPHLAQDINVRGTHCIIRSCRGRLIFASTSAVYGEAKEYLVNENHQILPLSKYGETKLSAEDLIVDNCLKYTVLRFSNIFGHGMTHKRTVADLFVDKAIRNENIRIHGDGKQRRDFVHINDVIRAYRLAMIRGIDGVFNIGGNEALSINDIYELTAKKCHQTLGWRPQKSYIADDCGRQWHDFEYGIDKAKQLLGYEPMYSISDEIGERINAYSRAMRN